MNESLISTSLVANAIDPYGQSAGVAPFQTPPLQSAIDAFSEKMSALQKTPEQSALEKVQASNGDMTVSLSEAISPANGKLTPANVLRAQEQWQHSVHVVDFAAKIMGSVSQSINKLVTMQ